MSVCLQVETQLGDRQDAAIARQYSRSWTCSILPTYDLNEHDLTQAMQKIVASVENVMREGSEWCAKIVLNLEISTVRYKPILVYGTFFSRRHPN